MASQDFAVDEVFGGDPVGLLWDDTGEMANLRANPTDASATWSVVWICDVRSCSW